MDPLTIYVFIAAGMAVVALFNGFVSFAHGGEYDDAHSHELMFKRTAWQALAVLFVLLAIALGSGGGR